jgi:tetratricopeptide (TPR) repeat protein
MTDRFKPAFVAAFVALVVALYLVYAPGLHGPFVLDDMHSIINNPNIKIDELSAESLYLSARSPRPGARIARPIVKTTFALNYYFSGKQLASFPFKVTNLVVHIFNTLLVLGLTTQLLRCLRARADNGEAPGLEGSVWLWFPVIVAALWALHPIQLTGVLYVVQRMTSLGAMCVLTGLLAFVAGRRRLEEGRAFGVSFMVFGMIFGGLLGGLCKENAILTPLYAFIIEMVFFDREKLSPTARTRLRAFFGVVLGLMVLAATFVLILKPELVTKLYAARNFTMYERLLTQSRALFLYLSLLIVPSLRSFSLYHDYLPISKSLLAPWTTVLSVVAWGALVAVALRMLKRAPIVSFAVLWYLAGHAVESSFLGLEIAFEHRNYLPSFGVLFALAYYGFRLAESRSLPRSVAVSMVCVVLATLSFVTYARAGAWSTLGSFAYFTVRNHPTSYRAQMERGYFQERDGHDVRDVYRSYRNAAAVNRHIVVPLIRMYRIVNTQAHALDSATRADPEDHHDDVRVDLLESDLVPYQSVLAELDRQIADEITHRILSYAISAPTIQSLDELRRCLVREPGACGSADRLEQWLATALSRTDVEQQRVGLLLISARFYAGEDRPSTAVELLRGALEAYPQSVGLLLELAHLNLSMDNFDEAQELLKRALAVTGTAGPRSGDVLVLQRRLRRKREAAVS